MLLPTHVSFGARVNLKMLKGDPSNMSSGFCLGVAAIVAAQTKLSYHYRHVNTTTIITFLQPY